MKLVNQMSYRAPAAWRPQPRIIEETAIGFLGVCFSWGEMDLSEKVLENVRFFVEACHNQSEITNPFGFEESLSSLENALRSGCLLANDVIYRLANKSSLSGGIECALFAKRGRELAILQIGQPHILLKRNSKLIPLQTGFDFLPSEVKSGAFIPNRLLGVTPSCFPQIRSVHIEMGDEIIVLAHSFFPSSLWQFEKVNDPEMKSLFASLVRETPQCPFWLSKLQL